VDTCACKNCSCSVQEGTEIIVSTSIQSVHSWLCIHTIQSSSQLPSSSISSLQHKQVPQATPSNLETWRNLKDIYTHSGKKKAEIVLESLTPQMTLRYTSNGSAGKVTKVPSLKQMRHHHRISGILCFSTSASRSFPHTAWPIRRATGKMEAVGNGTKTISHTSH
jgi:hypothetical protein